MQAAAVAGAGDGTADKVFAGVFSRLRGVPTGKVEGDGPDAAVAQVEKMMTELSTLAESGYRVRQEDVRTAIRVSRQAPDLSLVEFFRPSDSTLQAARRLVSPRSLNQYLYMRSMLEHDIVISVGPGQRRLLCWRHLWRYRPAVFK